MKKKLKSEKKAEEFTETVESSVNDSVQEDFVLTKNTDAINSYPAPAELKDYAAEIVSSVDTQKEELQNLKLIVHKVILEIV